MNRFTIIKKTQNFTTMTDEKFNDLRQLGLGALNVLLKLVELKGYESFSQSMRNLARDLCLSTTATHGHLSKLERYGYISIDKDNKRKFVYHFNVECIKSLLNDRKVL